MFRLPAIPRWATTVFLQPTHATDHSRDHFKIMSKYRAGIRTRGVGCVEDRRDGWCVRTEPQSLGSVKSTAEKASNSFAIRA